MVTVLTALKGRTSTTGRFLAQALNVKFTCHSIVSITQCDLLIRWGNSSAIIPHKYVVNSREAIADTAKKDKALYLMEQARVKVPPFLPIKSKGDVDTVEHLIPGFLRGRYHQEGGKLKYVATPNEFIEAMEKDTYDYIIQEIHKTQEWRIHVGKFMGAELLYVQRKLRRPDAELVKVWNHDNGWTFNTRAPSSIANYLIIDEAKRAVEALGLDFGAADILVDECGDAWVIEVNTAPALTIIPSQGSYIKFFEEVKANVQDNLHS